MIVAALLAVALAAPAAVALAAPTAVALAAPTAVALAAPAAVALAAPAAVALAAPAAVAAPASTSAPASKAQAWRPLAPGVDYAAIAVEKPVPIGDGVLHVVRIDPAKAELRAHLASEPGERPRTAKDWCAAKGLAVAINLGMYQIDMTSNVGYARKGTLKNNGGFNAYKSYLAFGRKRPDLAPAVLIDAEEPGARGRLADYDTVVQNLRLIRAPGANVWSKQDNRWTEAAIAADRDGRILFLFTRTPFTMWELNRVLLGLPLGIRNAMHVEGGPEASLSISVPGFELHLNGSYETGFRENDSAVAQWPIPNVIGVAPLARPPRLP